MNFSESLKKNKDFSLVYRKGRSYANRYLVMYVLKNGTKRNRLGISVSKKVGNSVIRHRVTRLVRESYRLNEKSFFDGLDIIVIARVTAKEAGFHELKMHYCIWPGCIKYWKRWDKYEYIKKNF